jgi:hypothetical protein
MGLVQLFPNSSVGGVGSFEPGALTTFPANVVPYIDGAQEVTYDANFTYQSTNLGIGLSTGLGARLHVKGANDSGSSFAFLAQSATHEIFKIENSRHILIGGGSKAANTEYTINAFGTGASSSDITLSVTGAGGDNVFRVTNSNGFTAGGVHILRGMNTNRVALTIGNLLTNASMIVQSSGAACWHSTGTLLSEFGYASSIGYIVDTGYVGQLYNIWGATAAGHIFQKGNNG